jgi:uroporphyrin-III C-methyltransferase/precorrin-2 dehydrogenase/sirohydrochlorin ferrochelatase
MDHFPAFLDLRERLVVVAGGGDAAAAKARLAAAAGARIRFAADWVDDTVRDEWRGRAEFRPALRTAEDVDCARIVFIAVDDEGEALAAAALARAAGALVCAVDRPALSDFITPAIVDRGAVVAAISTGGAAPVLARRLRERLEAALPARIGQLADFLSSFRSRASSLAVSARRAFYERLADGPAAERVLAGDEAGAQRIAEEALQNAHMPQAGVVHLVGAGPGDPDLLTIAALRALQNADVIFHDRLVAPQALDLARRDARRIYVGKREGDHSVPQLEIESAMIAEARAGRRVVRLKGGDPFIFGRGGEELEALQKAGIDVVVIPGVTAAIGAAASARFSLTHRDHAQAVTFATGHARDDGEPDLDWRALAALNQTLVIYMGVGRARSIASRLIAAGLPRATPVVAIENATHTDERLLTGTIDGLGDLVEMSAITGPALLVIGEVAAQAKPRALGAARIAA